MAAIKLEGLQGGFAAAPLGAKIFLLIAMLVVLASGYYLGIHMTLMDDIESEISRHGRLQQSLKDAQERQKKYLELREELAGREALDRQNLRVLPEDPEIPAFLGDLNRLVELTGLNLGSVKPNPEQAEEFYVKVPVSLSMSGKFHQIGKFFYNISRLERAVNMENVSLTGPEVVGEDIVLRVRVLATTFRRKVEDGK
jgi:type IV pilus assembly protein PilO